MRLFDEHGNSPGQVIDEAQCLDAAAHNMILAIRFVSICVKAVAIGAIDHTSA